MGKQWKKWQTIFLGSKITADGDCSHEIKRRLLLGRKVMTNLESIFKSRDMTLPTKVLLVKAMVFPVVMYGCEIWTLKKAEHQSIDAFELWCSRRLLRVPWTARRSNQSILKEIGLEKEEWNWRNQPAWLQALLQSHSHQDSMILAQRQKYRSMEQNRKPRDKSTHLWTPNLWQRRQEHTME